MEMELSHETIRLNETAYDGSLEQTIEHEYQLPDYYPGIFKLLQCRVEPHICACRTSGDQLVIDGTAVVKLLYIDEDDGAIHSLEQELPFSKTVELKGNLQNPSVRCEAKTDYINCRIISPRKIDLRGALTIHVDVQTQQEELLLSNAQGAGIQLNRNPITVSGEQHWTCRQFTLSEQLDVNPPAEEILDVRVQAIAENCKLIANKAITKGTAYICILYRPVGGGAPKVMQATCPISQIIDLPGVDEDYLCDVRYEATSTDVALAQEGASLNLDMDITVQCSAVLKQEVQAVTDVYSTDFEVNTSLKEMKSPSVIHSFEEQLVSNQSFDFADLQELYDCWCNVSELAGSVEQGALHFTARLNVTMLGTDQDAAPALAERSIPIEFDIAWDGQCDMPEVKADAQAVSCECSLSNGRIDLKAVLFLKGIAQCVQQMGVVSDLVLDESKPREKSQAALTLYYPEEGDSIWNIAKRFSTSPQAIQEANGLEQTTVSGNTMLMIPIV